MQEEESSLTSPGIFSPHSPKINREENGERNLSYIVSILKDSLSQKPGEQKTPFFLTLN